MSGDMARLNPAWVEAVSELVNTAPFFELMSMRVGELGLGCSRLAIKVRKDHLQPFGIVHGGVYASLIDAAGFWAAYPGLGEGLSLTTVEMKLNYLAPAKGGELIGLGEVIKQGRTLTLAQARIEDPGGRLLAHGSVTLMALADLPMAGQDDLPPKYLD